MEDYRINIHYAKALFLVAVDTQQLDVVADDMRLVNTVCRENHVLNKIFSNPVIREDKKLAVLRDLFEDTVSKVTMLFLKYIVKKRRAVNLKGISNSYIELYRKEKNIVLSHLVTAVEIDEEMREAFRKVVGEYTHSDVELHSKVDPSILGGFSVTFDNNMYDARVSSEMVKLRKEFSKNLYESKL